MTYFIFSFFTVGVWFLPECFWPTIEGSKLYINWIVLFVMHPYMRDFPLTAKGMDKYLMGETAHQLKSNFETMDARKTEIL